MPVNSELAFHPTTDLPTRQHLFLLGIENQMTLPLTQRRGDHTLLAILLRLHE